MPDVQNFAKLLEALPSISPGLVIANGWKKYLQDFFENGSEDEYAQFRPGTFAKPSTPVSDTASSCSLQPVTTESLSVGLSGALSSAGAPPPTPPTSQSHNPPPPKALSVIEWSPPSTKRRRVSSSEPRLRRKIVDKAVKSVSEHKTTLFPIVNVITHDRFSSPYSNLGHDIKRTSQLDRLHVLLVSHVVDEQECSLRGSQEHCNNYRSEATTLAAQKLGVAHDKILSMGKAANKYLGLLPYGTALVFAIGIGSKHLWEKEMNHNEIREAGERLRQEYSEEKNFVASVVILDALSQYGFNSSNIILAESRLVKMLGTLIDLEQFGRGRFQMRHEKKWIDIRDVRTKRLDSLELWIRSEGDETSGVVRQDMGCVPNESVSSQLIVDPLTLESQIADEQQSTQICSQGHTSRIEEHRRQSQHQSQRNIPRLPDPVSDNRLSPYSTIRTENERPGHQQSMAQLQNDEPTVHVTDEADVEAMIAALFHPCWTFRDTDLANLTPMENAQHFPETSFQPGGQ